MSDSTLPECVVRDLRDVVFGHKSTDKNWTGCRDGWMKPENIEWLKQKAKQPTKQ